MLVELDATVDKHGQNYKRKRQNSIHLQIIFCAELEIGRLDFANVAQLKEVLLQSVHCLTVAHWTLRTYGDE